MDLCQISATGVPCFWPWLLVVFNGSLYIGGLRGSFKIPSPSTSLPVGSQSGKFLEILGRCEKTHIVRRIASDAQAGASS